MRRRLALALLRLMLRISTPATHPWAAAMLAEASHVEGGWATLMWALGSSGVLLKCAVTDRLARPEKDLMQRPRILFSVGFTFLLLAGLATILIAPKAYTAYMRYATTDATITSVDFWTRMSHPAFGPQHPVYMADLHLQFRYNGVTYAPIEQRITRDAAERDQWVREYAVGKPYRVMFNRDSPGLNGPNHSGIPVLAIRTIFLGCLGFLILSSAMVYVGKKKAI